MHLWSYDITVKKTIWKGRPKSRASKKLSHLSSRCSSVSIFEWAYHPLLHISSNPYENYIEVEKKNRQIFYLIYRLKKDIPWLLIFSITFPITRKDMKAFFLCLFFFFSVALLFSFIFWLFENSPIVCVIIENQEKLNASSNLVVTCFYTCRCLHAAEHRMDK